MKLKGNYSNDQCNEIINIKNRNKTLHKKLTTCQERLLGVNLVYHVKEFKE